MSGTPGCPVVSQSLRGWQASLRNVKLFLSACSNDVGSLVCPQESHLNVDQALTAEAQDEPAVHKHRHVTACSIRLHGRRCTG